MNYWVVTATIHVRTLLITRRRYFRAYNIHGTFTHPVDFRNRHNLFAVKRATRLKNKQRYVDERGTSEVMMKSGLSWKL
jgi:hypothetical protein